MHWDRYVVTDSNIGIDPLVVSDLRGPMPTPQCGSTSVHEFRRISVAVQRLYFIYGYILFKVYLMLAVVTFSEF